ncbi:MAG: hypothetical protein ACPGID_09385 [Rubricella sp.]
MTLFTVTMIAVLAGGFLGAWRAYRRKGDILDILQYGFGHAVAFGIVTMLVLVVADLVI